MLQDLIELLDRQFQFLLRQEGAAFLRELRRTFEVLQREPRLASLLDDERRSAIALMDAFEEHERRLTRELVELRNHLARVVPELDDSNTRSPGDENPWAWPKWLRTLAAFDRIAGGERLSAPDDTVRDRSRSGQLLGILRKKVDDAQRADISSGGSGLTDEKHRPEFGSIQQRLSQLGNEHDEVWCPFYDAVLTQPGTHLFYVEDLISRMSRRWPDAAQRIPQLECIIKLLRLPNEYRFRSLLYDPLDYERKAAEGIDEDIARLRTVAERIHEGLRMRIGTTRSLLALFNRFRTRCQFHDRERLIELVKRPPRSYAQRASRNERNKAEQALTEELARYLFDQGLNPLTEVPTAGLRPDVLEPGHLYVEAKQYGGSRNPRSYLLKGARQVHETIGRLRGSAYQVYEAFYVVFRLGGRRVDFPEAPVSCGDWTLYPILIDLAPASESGSRAKEPIVITAEELRSRADASAESRSAQRRR